MTRKRLPSELIADIKTKLEQIRAKVGGVTKGVVYGYEAISAGEPYWRGLDESFKSGKIDEVAASGYDFLESLDAQMRAIDRQAGLAADQVQSFVSNVGMYADVTGSTATMMGLPFDFDGVPLKQLRYSFDVHDDYSQRLGRIDPGLSVEHLQASKILTLVLRVIGCGRLWRKLNRLSITYLRCLCLMMLRSENSLGGHRQTLRSQKS